MKTTPAHHKTVAIKIGRLADGYGGRFQIVPNPGWWEIVAAAPVTNKTPPAPHGYRWVIVAPARGGK